MSRGGGGSKDLMGKKFRWLNFGQTMHMAKFPSVVDPELCRIRLFRKFRMQPDPIEIEKLSDSIITISDLDSARNFGSLRIRIRCW
jgi:hypothetical protein